MIKNSNDIRLFLLLLALPLLQPLAAQQVNYLPVFDVAEPGRNFALSAASQGRHLIIRTDTAAPSQLRVTNTEGVPGPPLAIDTALLAPGRQLVPFPSETGWTVLVQYVQKEHVYLSYFKLSFAGALLSTEQLLDSSRIALLGQDAYFRLLANPASGNLFIYRLLTGVQQGKLILDGIWLNPSENNIQKFTHILPLEPTGHHVLPIFQHRDGRAYFGFLEQNETYKLLCRLTIFSITAQGELIALPQVEYKGVKPVNPVFAQQASSGQLVLASLYQDHPSGYMDGILLTEIPLLPSGLAKTRKFAFSKKKTVGLQAAEATINLRYKEKRNDQLSLRSCVVDSVTGTVSLVVVNNQGSFQGAGQSSYQASKEKRGMVEYNTSDQIFSRLRSDINSINNNVRFPITGPNVNSFAAPGMITMDNGFYNWGNSVQKTSNSGEQTYEGKIGQALRQSITYLQFDGVNTTVLSKNLNATIPAIQLPIRSTDFTLDSATVLFSVGVENNGRFQWQWLNAEQKRAFTAPSKRKVKQVFWRGSMAMSNEATVLGFYLTAEKAEVGMVAVRW